MLKNDISRLLEKHKKGTISAEERDFLDAWYINYATEKNSSFEPNHLHNNLALLWNGISDGLSDQGFSHNALKPKKQILWPRIAAAICLIAISVLVFNHYKNTTKNFTPKKQLISAAIQPGTNKAWLTLADGSRISLSDAKNGALTRQAGIALIKTADGQLIYEIAGHSTRNTGQLTYNTIETPRGGQFQINLPDGSKVWLNAASTLKYPVSFSSAGTRKIELNGEAYFEVAKDKKRPFIVKSEGQEIEVLGTHFNVNSYADNKNTKTTLLEGAIRVKVLQKDIKAQKEFLLKPGQQASLINASFNVKDVDPEESIAWKNGQFMFRNESLKDVMKEISRWYNVEVAYKGQFSNIALAGSVSKFISLPEVLEVLELTGKIRFDIDGRKITVIRLNE